MFTFAFQICFTFEIIISVYAHITSWAFLVDYMYVEEILRWEFMHACLSSMLFTIVWKVRYIYIYIYIYRRNTRYTPGLGLEYTIFVEEIIYVMFFLNMFNFTIPEKYHCAVCIPHFFFFFFYIYFICFKILWHRINIISR